jgi:excisionase family DNA binding protein
MRTGNLGFAKWKPSPDELPELLTPLEVAEKLNVSRRTVYRWIKAGRMTPQRVGDMLVQIPVTEVQRFLAESNNAQKSPVAVIPDDDDVPTAEDVQAELTQPMKAPAPVVRNKPKPKGRR